MRDRHPLPGTDVVVDGARLHVVAHGRPGTAPPVLLLHGLGTSSYLWRDVMRDVEHDLLTVAPDLLGLGRSERRPPADYAPAAQAARLVHLLDALGHERAVVAGHDLGAAVAVALAAAAPTRVSALVLCSGVVHADAWPPRHIAPLLIPGLGQAYVTALRHVPGAARSATARALGLDASTPIPDAELDGYLGPLSHAGSHRALRSVARAADLGSVQRAWRSVCSAAPPTLLLWGDRDHVHPLSYGKRLAADLPAAVWSPVSDVGHLLPEERPERFAEELTGFLAEHAAA